MGMLDAIIQASQGGQNSPMQETDGIPNNISQPNTGAGIGGGVSGGTGNPILDEYIKKLGDSSRMLQNRVLVPPQMPPRQGQAGDVSGNFVNPNTQGGPARNARVTMAQSIGKVASDAVNHHEQEKSRNLAIDLQTVENAINVMNDPNADPAHKELAKKQAEEILNDPSKAKAIQKALNIQFFGGEDKRKDYEKKAVEIWRKGGQQGPPPQQQQQGAQRLQQLQDRLPQIQGLSTQAMAQAELTKAGAIPTANTKLEALTTLLSDQNKMDMLTQRLGFEQTKTLLLAQLRQNETMIKSETMRAIAEARDVTQLKSASIRAGAEIKSAQIHADAAKDIATAKNTITTENDKLKLQKETLKLQQDGIDKQITALTATKNTAIKNKDKATRDTVSSQLELLQTQNKELRQQLDQLGGQIQTNDTKSQSLDELNSTFDSIWGDSGGDAEQQ
jgi:hypothetical protein